MDRHACWHEALERLVHMAPDQELGARLLLFWNVYGFHIAWSLRGDPVLIDALRRHIPPYSGPGLTLYRGELASRHDECVYGIAWTTQLHTAEVFASRRYPGEGYGVVLKIDATPEMIIAPPTAHSFYLEEAEFLIDTRQIRDVLVVRSAFTE